jgi:hypothetical protein
MKTLFIGLLLCFPAYVWSYVDKVTTKTYEAGVLDPPWAGPDGYDDNALVAWVLKGNEIGQDKVTPQSDHPETMAVHASRWMIIALVHYSFLGIIVFGLFVHWCIRKR